LDKKSQFRKTAFGLFFYSENKFSKKTHRINISITFASHQQQQEIL